MNSRIIQAIACVTLLLGVAVCASLLGPINHRVETDELRYTDVSVEGAPPIVVLGTAIGALRGLIVDYLWIKVNIMKEKGLFYEVMADADLITKLQPRFASVWAFHGHNMAYNISVATNTKEERWTWVMAGIDLVRNRGLRYNPNDLVLYRELGFWFDHKIEGTADDANLYYKSQLAREWQYLLGESPESHEDRIAWMKEIADAPDSIERAKRSTPQLNALIVRLRENISPYAPQGEFKLNKEFLLAYGEWETLTRFSTAANVRGLPDRARQDPNSFFVAIDAIANDPSVEAEWKTLIATVRKKVLRDDYNMDPQIMYEFTRDVGPIDWRSGYAHELYWTRLGEIRGELRIRNEDDIYKVLNNDRQQMHAMQGLARYGRILYDPFSGDAVPSRFPDPRWIDAIFDSFDYFYAKHFETRGAGGESFIAFLQNFMSSAIREAYRAGEIERAEEMLALLDEKFGRGSDLPDPKYSQPLEAFVQSEIAGELWFQPHLGISEVSASLRQAYRLGVGQNNRKLYDDIMEYVAAVITIFKENRFYDFESKLGTGRVKELLADFETVRPRVFHQVMTDPTIPVREKISIWANIDKFDQNMRLFVYDMMAQPLRQQFERNELAMRTTFEKVFPQPPGLEEFRVRVAQMQEQMAREAEAKRQRDQFEQRGSTEN